MRVTWGNWSRFDMFDGHYDNGDYGIDISGEVLGMSDSSLDKEIGKFSAIQQTNIVYLLTLTFTVSLRA